VHISTVFNFRNICLQSLEVRVDLLRDRLSGSAASEGLSDDFFEFTAAIGNETLDELAEWNVSDHTINLVCDIFHLIKQLVETADELHFSGVIQKT
jgi:hypothetical protein